MPIWQRNLWVLWIGVFFTAAGFSMVIPFLPIFLLEIGVHDHTELWSGLIYGAAFFAGAIATPFWGRIADKYGRKPMIIRAGLALFVVYTLMAFVTNAYQILILRVMQGLLSGFIPGSITLVGTNTPAKKVGYALSMISSASATGMIVGPLLGGGLAELWGSRWAFGSAGIIVLLATILIIFFVREENFKPNKEKGSVFKDFSVAINNRPFLVVLILSLLVSCSMMIIDPILPLYIADIASSSNYATLLTGFVISLPGLASALFAPIWGKWADKVGFQRVLFIGLLGAGIGTIAQIGFTQIWGFSVIRFVYGVFSCAIFPALNGLVVRSTPEEFRGRAFSLNQTSSQIGGMFGPLLGGVLGGLFPTYVLFSVTGVMLLIAMGAAYLNEGQLKMTYKREMVPKK